MFRYISNSKKLSSTFKQSLRSLFIQTQTTPNENALKFIPSDTKILPTPTTPTIEINSIKESLNKSELAFKLLSINDKTISSILFGHNFITIVKNDKSIKNKNPDLKSIDWSVLKPQIFSILTEHITMGQSVLNDEYFNHLKEREDKAKTDLENENNENNEFDEFDEELDPKEEVVALIKELLVTRIQPAIQEDGGDIKFIKFDDINGTVYLKLIGACKSCSSSEITLKNGIEEMLRYYIDEVKSVQQILDEDIENGLHNEKEVESEIKSTDKNELKFQKLTVDELPPSL